jgi:hypothetical protein
VVYYVDMLTSSVVTMDGCSIHNPTVAILTSSYNEYYKEWPDMCGPTVDMLNPHLLFGHSGQILLNAPCPQIGRCPLWPQLPVVATSAHCGQPHFCEVYFAKVASYANAINTCLSSNKLLLQFLITESRTSFI